MHRREALLDPLHGLVLAVAVRRPSRGEGQDPWSCSWSEYIVPVHVWWGIVWLGRWAAGMANSSSGVGVSQFRSFASLTVSGRRVFPWFVMPELSFSAE